jgi:hypothetical protein
MKKVFKNDIVSLVKIQIYSNLIFLKKIKKSKKCKKTRTNSDQISDFFFKKMHCFIG